jgi:predicted CXXCH cytochrome family protein
MSEATNYQSNCAPCHTSQLRTRSGDIAPGDLEFREGGINCETCHGPSAEHVARMQRGEAQEYKSASAPPVEFGRLSAGEYVDICSQCHMQSKTLQVGEFGAVNYSGVENPFFQAPKNPPFRDFAVNGYYKDGRFAKSTFIIESFRRSECFTQGEAHCGSCHNPHPADATTNPTSLKFTNEPNRMCTQCHSDYAANPESHTRHAANSEAGECVACHMPPIMGSLMSMTRTHRIDDKPDAAATARFGPRESPSACLQCHEAEGMEWLGRELLAWPQPTP